jgi:hypothetical protein
VVGTRTAGGLVVGGGAVVGAPPTSDSVHAPSIGISIRGLGIARIDLGRIGLGGVLIERLFDVVLMGAQVLLELHVRSTSL